MSASALTPLASEACEISLPQSGGKPQSAGTCRQHLADGEQPAQPGTRLLFIGAMAGKTSRGPMRNSDPLWPASN